MKFYLLDELDWKAKAKVRNLKFRSRLRNTTKGCDDSLRSHCFLLTLAPFLMKVKHRRSRLLPKLFVTILNPSVQPKIQMTLSPVFFFSELIFFYSFLHKRNVKMKGETKVTQTGLKKGGKSCSFNVLLIIIFGLLFCPFCALATLIALRPFGESMYGKKV